MKKIFTLLFCSCFFGAFAQTTVLFTPVQYNTIYEAPNTSNGAGFYFFTGRTGVMGGNEARRGLLLFDLSSIPAGSTITDVNLTMFVSLTVAGPEDVSLHTVSQSWGQGTSDAPDEEEEGAPSTANDASWNCSFNDGAGGCTTSWMVAGGDFDPSPDATTSVEGASAFYVWDDANMVATVQNWADNSGDNFGWIVIGNESVGGTAKRFNAVGDNEPVLEVTYNAPMMNVVKNDFAELITTYPNPTSGIVAVEFQKNQGKIRVKVSNMLGQTVSTYTEESAYKLNIELSGAPGIYFVELVSDDGKKAIIKILKK